MSSPLVTSASAERYLTAVEQQLADLPAEERTALLEDLSMHLDALTLEDDDRPLELRLGAPDAYAAELRSAAGLPPRTGSRTTPLPDLRADLARLTSSRAAREVRAFVPQLRPGWWVLRGYLLVAVPSLAGVDGSRDFPVPSPAGSSALGMLLVLAAVVGSVALGRRQLPRAAALLVLVVDIALLVAALQLAAQAPGRLGSVVVGQAGQPVSLDQPLLSRYGPVTDVLPYAADGTPLEGVLLFDQDGRPLQVGRQEWWADGCRRVLAQPRAADGVPVPYSYPQAYVLDPSGRDRVGGLVQPGQCAPERTWPPVPIPTFPAPPAPPAVPPAAG